MTIPTGPELKAWRKSLGLSQPKMAERLPVDIRTWQRWEYGETTPPQYFHRVMRDIEREIATGGKHPK